MTDIKLEKCVCGADAKLNTGNANYWVYCSIYRGCWTGPTCKTPEEAASTWNAVMRAMRAGAQVPQVAGGAVSKTTPSAVIGDDLTRGPSVEAPAILDDKAFARVVAAHIAGTCRLQSSRAATDLAAKLINDFADAVVAERIKREKERAK